MNSIQLRKPDQFLHGRFSDTETVDISYQVYQPLEIPATERGLHYAFVNTTIRYNPNTGRPTNYPAFVVNELVWDSNETYVVDPSGLVWIPEPAQTQGKIGRLQVSVNWDRTFDLAGGDSAFVFIDYIVALYYS